MTKKNQDYEFILNRWAFGKDGALVNVSQIKAAKAEAESRILEILQELEKMTGMVVASVDTETDFDDDLNNLGVIASPIKLELE
jgi:hypothetical protein